MDILWWEKTVEYFFVHKYADLNKFIAPLDGGHEKAGDAIFSNVNKWVLIEFKRDKRAISDEIGKFTNYTVAKSVLEPIGSHHLIIYGDIENYNFMLKSKQYFSGKEVAIEKALISGAEKDCFISYLNKFVEFKKTSKGGAGGYSFVAGVSSDGKVTTCVTVSEFEQVLQQKHLNSHEEKNHDTSLDMEM